MVKRKEPFTDKNAVFILQLHDVSDRGNRHIFDKFPESSVSPAAEPVQAVHQLPGDSRPAETRKRVGFILSLRINDRLRRRQEVLPVSVPVHAERNFVMIGHDSPHSQLVRQGNLFRRRYAVVAGKQQLYAVRRCLPYKILIQSVAVPQPLRNSYIHTGSQTAQSLQQNTGGHDAVNVIIPDNPYPRFLLNCLFQNFRRFRKILHSFRRVKISPASVEIFPDSLLSDHIPVADQPRRHLVNMELSGNLLEIRFFGRHHPALSVHLHFFIFLPALPAGQAKASAPETYLYRQKRLSPSCAREPDGSPPHCVTASCCYQ